MERTVWTDERLNDAMTRIDARFDAVDRRFDRLEARMDAGFAEMRAEFSALRRDMHQMAVIYGVGYLGLAAGVIAAVA